MTRSHISANNRTPISHGEHLQYSLWAPDGCYYQEFVDGMRVYSYDRTSLPPDIDGVADLSLIHGIEVYGSGARTPPQYNGTGAACGTIVIWLKR